ncbi:hypothetical protein FQN57_006436 [Myotisia sp. PD_48]|nr:hypothetical protein FQN57_006436 [Myotisia sp. PD_48]
MSESEESTSSILLGKFTSVNRPPAHNPAVSVTVPVLFNSHEYNFLPGCTTVNHVLQALSPDIFKVRLQSGDIQALPRRKILRLDGGREALDSFNSPDNYSLSEASTEDELARDDSPAASEDEQHTRRLPPRRAATRKNYVIPTNSFDDSDELGPSIRKSRRLLRLPTRTKKDSRGPVYGTRTSKRQKNVISMAKRLEEDTPNSEVPNVGPRYIGIKEFFEPLSQDDPFRQRHQPVCRACCSTKGPLVFCQGCTDSYHQACLGPQGRRTHLVSKVNANLFILQCRNCLGYAQDSIAPHYGLCSSCTQPGTMSTPLRPLLTLRQVHLQREENGGEDPCINVDESKINATKNVMFRCSSCKRAWHLSHLPPKSKPLLEEEMNEDRLADKRFKEYSRRWMCNDCANSPKDIQSLIAWRPTDLNSYIPGYSSDMIPESSKEYLIQWRKLSFFQASWMPGAWVWGVTTAPMRNAFNKSEKSLKPKMTAEDAIPDDYLIVDIVLDVEFSHVVSERTMKIDLSRAKEVKRALVKYRALTYEESVWEEPPKDPERWCAFQAAYEDWVLGNYVQVPKHSSLARHLSSTRAKDFARTLVKHSQPEILTGGQLMDYQKDGLNWLYFMWYKSQNAILADEMGLGKTIQVIAFFATLVQDHKCWPFLVVVPNSTCPNWRKEIKIWAPSLRVVTYYGSSAARKIAHDYEMFPRGSKDLRCHIVVTSYETMVDDKSKHIISSIPWAGLVVDEGHRLKNDKSLLYNALSKINFPFKLLLTGTPLQNNIRELFNIIQFCDSTRNAEELEEEYGTITKDNVGELHHIIRPFFLRRTKVQVLTFLPPMAQIIVPVSMTVVQKKLYKSILAKNPTLIRSIFNYGSVKPTERHSLNNILMQLRKCLCHPFVYSKAIEDRGVNSILLHRNMVEASGKLQLLELLLPRLRDRGHRVLIFSQFLDFLDIIEDFLDGLGLQHLRLDGSMESLKKQRHIDQFNAENSPYFAFLLSTRAGGVGINLASADTVIILDPDFNPHADIQALSRAHRIGQQKKVLVFQLITRGSAEEKILQVGRKKLALDHVLIERMDAEEDAGLDLESILRHGLQALFDNDTTDDISYDAQSIDKLLERSEQENTRTGDDASAESQFSYARVWMNESMEDNDLVPNTPPTDGSVWEKILKERERAAEEDAKAKAQTFGRGKRKRQVVQYTLPRSPRATADDHGRENRSATNSDFDGHLSESITSPQSQEGRTSRALSQLIHPFKRASVTNDSAPPPNGAIAVSQEEHNDADPNQVTCIACDKVHPVGYCLLRLAGVEHCGLCGSAHYGHGRACTHLNSELQVALMLGALKQSTESAIDVDLATKYLRGIRGGLVQRRRQELKKAGNLGQEQEPQMRTPSIPSGAFPQ